MTFLLILCVLSFPTAVFTDSHSLSFLVTYIHGETPFPAFSIMLMLDDIIVGYYESDTNVYVPRGNTTNEDEEVALTNYELKDYSQNILRKFLQRSKNKTEGPVVQQMLSVCDLSDNDKHGQMITKLAFQGSTTEELHYFDDTLTYQGIEKLTTLHLEMYRWRHATAFYPHCSLSLKKYLKKRATQGKRKVKPRVRLIQKANSDSGGFRVSCLATGFYPRHLNLSLFRDGQPVSDHEVTGGDLLPNGDGTYQMRKSLEIRGDERHKHTYSCSATHLSLDNSMTVDLEFDHGDPFKSVIPSVLSVLALVLMCGVAVIIKTKWHKDSCRSGYSTPSTSEENVEINVKNEVVTPNNVDE